MAFVPVLTEVKETRSHAELKELVSRTAGTLGLILLVVTALGVLGAGWVARGFAPGSIDEPEKFALTTDLLRLTFPFLLFVSLTALAGGILNSFNKFALPAVTPVILNLCMIAGALWLSPHLDVPIMAMGGDPGCISVGSSSTPGAERLLTCPLGWRQRACEDSAVMCRPVRPLASKCLVP